MKLTKEILIDLIYKSLDNAKNLVQEGKILQNFSRLARSYTLYQIALEELGKAMISYKILVVQGYKDSEASKLFIKCMKEHHGRIRARRTFDDLMIAYLKKADVKDDFKSISTEYSSITEYSARKNSSLYTELKGESVIQPDEVITQEIVEVLSKEVHVKLEFARMYFDSNLPVLDEVIKHLELLTPEEKEEMLNKVISDLTDN